MKNFDGRQFAELFGLDESGIFKSNIDTLVSFNQLSTEK